MSLLSRIKALEERTAELVPGTVVLTLANHKTLRTTETRLQSIFEEAAAVSCPSGNFYDQRNPPHVLTAAEIDTVPGLRQLINVRESLPPVLRSIQQLVRGPLGWHLDAEAARQSYIPLDSGSSAALYSTNPRLSMAAPGPEW
jgi:hypothetical protein